MTQRYTFTRISHNRKTGPIPVTHSHRDTCPDSCALKNNGCYAEGGFVAIHWAKLNKNRLPGALNAESLAAEIRALPRRTLWRHNIAGDLPGHGDQIDAAKLAQIANASRGKQGFTYTHKPATPENVAAMKAASSTSFVINLSADNAAQADGLAVHGLPLVCVIPTDAGKVTRTPQGRKVVQCPAENTRRVTCASCGLCAVADRNYIIGFKAHGHNTKTVNQIAQGDS